MVPRGDTKVSKPGRLSAIMATAWHNVGKGEGGEGRQLVLALSPVADVTTVCQHSMLKQASPAPPRICLS
jgi:hypothetical protein